MRRSGWLDNAKLCLLVLIGATEDGKKELIAVEDGYRGSEASWLELLRSLEARGLAAEPKLAIGDGALGFWKALAQVWGNTKIQRCWVHQTGNVLNRLPKAVQPKAKQALQQIWMAETREAAQRAFGASSRPMKRNIRRRCAVSRRTATPYSPSTTFRPSTGRI